MIRSLLRCWTLVLMSQSIRVVRHCLLILVIYLFMNFQLVLSSTFVIVQYWIFTSSYLSLVLVNYLIWIFVWMAFIHSLNWFLYPSIRRNKSKKRNSKHKHRLRYVRRPFYKRNQSLSMSSKRQHSTVSTDNSKDEAESEENVPYWKTLHKSPHLDVWDDICSKNSDILSFLFDPSNLFCLRRDRTMSIPTTFGASVIDVTSMTSLNNTFRFQSIFYTQDSKQGAPIIFDSGASITLSPYKSDFSDGIKEVSQHEKLHGISSSSAIKGVGKISLLVHDDNGNSRRIITDAFYVPDARVRLLSICRYRENYPNEGCSFVLDDNGCRFRFPHSQGGGVISFHYRSSNYIPQTTAYSQQFGKSHSNSQSHKAFMILDNSNINLTQSQKELLKWHFRLGHFNMPLIQRLISKKILNVMDSEKVTSKNALCKCMACQLAKQTKSPDGVKKMTINKTGSLIKDNLRPGGMVSTDQFVSKLPGRLPNTYGKESDIEKYIGGTVFIDEASGYFSVHNQVSLGAQETVRAKNSFEREAIRHGVPILGYRGDNGIYRSMEFRRDLDRYKQSIKFSGVGAHHQNGIAERGIRTISSAARAMMIHAMIHWPENVQLDLWPFAINYAVYLWNRLPQSSSGLSPQELFFSVKSDHQELRMAKVWGCPAYVLDPRIQDGKKIPRWSPRSKMGQFLGRSTEHAGSIGLIRNLKTNAISSQFHVVYDNEFTTVTSDWSNDNIPVPPNFHNLFKFSRELHIDKDDVLDERRQLLFNKSPSPSSNLQPPISSSPVDSSPAPQRLTTSSSIQSNGEESVPSEAAVPAPLPTSIPSSSTTQIPSSDSEVPSIPNDVPSTGRTRSGRSFRSMLAIDTDYLSYISKLNDRLDTHDAFLVESDLNTKSTELTRTFDAYASLQVLSSDINITTGIHPLAFSTRANAEDTPRFHEAMRGPDREGFIIAMRKEMDQLSSLNAFEAVPRQKAIDENKQIVDVTWALKRKRYPDGSVNKLKARLCVRGDKQIIDEAFDTYSPVVQWATVRLLLILSILLQLSTKQVDFTLAFVQAEAKPGTYIEMPDLFEKEGYILELKRNLYGQQDSPIRFYEHLKKGLVERGFYTSKFDPCLFYSQDVLILVYVDDCIFISREDKNIDTVIQSLKTGKLANGKLGQKYMLEVEGDYAGFLGIHIDKNDELSHIELKQHGLIDRILAVLGLDDDDVTIRHVPADIKPLGKDENGPPRKEHWSYPSIIGMMLYLTSNSRPDIAFAVNQCARFNSCPRLCHEKAVKRIGRYLKATRDRGLILKPNDNMNISMYADADFAGLWNIEHPDDPVSVRSRTGYIITLCGLPVCWSSKLQTEIATSTMMAEYIALSSGMRQLLPTIDLFNEICENLNIARDKNDTVVKVFEDNEGALKLASKELPRYTPNSKHFGVKYHWFREKLKDPDYNIDILPIDTKDQLADIFTKGLGKVDYSKKRDHLMGWNQAVF